MWLERKCTATLWRYQKGKKWGKVSPCWSMREWSIWSKQLPTGNNNFKEVRHFTWHFNLPTSARIQLCFGLILLWPLFYHPAKRLIRCKPVFDMVITCLFTRNSMRASPRDKTHKQIYCAALCFRARRWGASLKVKFIFCSQIDSKMPVRVKGLFHPTAAPSSPLPCLYHTTSHHTVLPCWPSDSSSCDQPLFILTKCRRCDKCWHVELHFDSFLSH